MPNKVTITLELDEDAAWHFALFLKRSHWGTYERLSDPTQAGETQKIADAVVAVQSQFREQGQAPR